MQRSLKLTFPREFMPLICLTYLSSSSTLSFVSLPTPTDISSWYYNVGIILGANCGMLIWMDCASMCWFWETRTSWAGMIGGEPESYVNGGRIWSSSFLIILLISCVKFLSSLLTSLNSVSDTVWCTSCCSILVIDLVWTGLWLKSYGGLLLWK